MTSFWRQLEDWDSNSGNIRIRNHKINKKSQQKQMAKWRKPDKITHHTRKKENDVTTADSFSINVTSLSFIRS